MDDSSSATVIDWNRTLSLLLALAYLVLAAVMRGGEGFFRMALFLVLPMASIWFSEAMGSAAVGVGTTVLSGGPAITKSSPGCVVRLVGWMLLLMPAVLAVIDVLQEA